MSEKVEKNVEPKKKHSVPPAFALLVIPFSFPIAIRMLCRIPYGFLFYME